MSLAMSRAERDAFLAGTHVGIVSIAEDGRGPLAVPVWYQYAPGGEVLFATADTSRKAALLRKAGRASLCVQTENRAVPLRERRRTDSLRPGGLRSPHPRDGGPLSRPADG